MAENNDTAGARWRARAEELEKKQWELERRVFLLETLVSIAREAGACHDLNAASRCVLNTLSGTLGTVNGVVLLYDQEAEQWRLTAQRGLVSEVAAPGGESGKRLLNWIAARPLPQTPASLAGSGLEPLAACLGPVHVAAPILRQGEPMGLILLGATLRDEPLDASDQELCAAVTATAAVIFGDIIATEHSLRQQQERFRIQGIFEQYCAPDVVERLIAEYPGLRIGGEQKIVTVLIADMRGFTSLIQRMPKDIEAVVNAYFAAMTDEVFAHSGTMDKFMGDAVMAVFGDPVSYGDDATRAVRCAQAMQRRFAELAARYPQLAPELGLGVGITTGKALCGVFGSPRRFQYTVMGPLVNLAARLSDLLHRSGIFLDRNTYERVSDWVHAAPLPPLRIRGFEQRISIYRLDE